VATKKAPTLEIVAHHKVVLAAAREVKSIATVTPVRSAVERPFRTILATNGNWPK